MTMFTRTSEPCSGSGFSVVATWHAHRGRFVPCPRCGVTVKVSKAGLIVPRHNRVVSVEDQLELLESLIEDEPCWFDHHGGCQAHGYLSLERGEVCPQQQAKNLLAGGSE